MSSMLLSAQQIKELFGIHRNTLLKWEKEGLLQPVKTPGGRRRYRRSDIEGLPGICEKKTEKADVILYARVSTKKQEEYLKNQIERLESFAREKGWSYEVISEIASGVNEVNGKENEEDRHRELTEDLIAIVTSFAARVYGSRGGKEKNDNTPVQTGI